MTWAVIALNLAVLLVLCQQVVRDVIADAIRRWPPADRRHHGHRCPECRCSYVGAPQLARHMTAQHGEPVRDHVALELAARSAP